VLKGHRQIPAVQDDEPAVAELLQPGQQALLLVGGRGGRGNHSFKTRLNTAPAIAERGEAGTEAWFDLELKVRGGEGQRWLVVGATVVVCWCHCRNWGGSK
jgi:hypothetical protein